MTVDARAGVALEPGLSSVARRAAVLLGLTAAYFVAGKLGLRLAFVHPSASPIWPPAGIALAAFLILGPRIWPAIFAGAFLVNLTTAGSAATSLGIAAGNTLEGLLGAFLVRRWAGGLAAFERPRDVLKFAVLAAGASTMVSATCGVTSLASAGFAAWGDYGSIWLTWWLGDATGDLLFAPVVLLWSANHRVKWRPRAALDAAALFGGLTLVGLVVFGGLSPPALRNLPLEFLCIPMLLWAPFRFGPRESATAVLLLSGIAVHGTLRGVGPFARADANESLLLIQTFLGVASVMSLSVASVVLQRRRVEARLRELSVSDALTGLANYRQLMTALESEIRRSQRTQRTFAVLFLDVDGLKQVNDRHGHVVGSRALCRVAAALRHVCRAVDLAARYGGDEFAVVLHEGDEAAAAQLGRRIRGQLALDMEPPRLSVSLGAAVFPRDGQTAEALLDAADRLLYDMKSRRGMAPHHP
ncbi:MAG TPA: MASE1 domain-containing protein [Vicinamibacteria bacterium]|nr:MASE1 domain-containing protein [Vicinamibacteria bacterium]